MTFKADLPKIARDIRVDIAKMFYIAGWGHFAPALSCVDILVALYWGGVINTHKLFEDDHDRVILSKGHGCAALYAVMSRWNYFPRNELSGFYQKGSPLIGLASSNVNGIDIPTGSLGHGICFATGTAISAKLSNADYYTYVILGDGESQEGSVWEAVQFAGAKHLDNMIVILDYNKLQGSDWLESIIPIEPIADKWQSFGWTAHTVDGHDHNALVNVLNNVKKEKNKPHLIIANTVKGKGVSIAEADPSWHSRAPKGKEWEQVCIDLGITMEELSKL